MHDVSAEDIEVLYYSSEIQNIDIIQVCRINFLNANRALFATFLLPVACVNCPVNCMLSVIKHRYEAAGYAASPI